MWLKKAYKRTFNLKLLELQSVVVSTLLLTLFLFAAWPRFRADALSVEWYWYLIFGFITLIPILRKGFKK